ncbi:MAG: hypothetical protein ACH34Y_01865 [Brachymonas sp.]|jgi:hypothetical protein
MIQNSSFAIFWHLCSNFQRKSRLLCAVGIGIILGLHTAAAGSLHLDTQDISQATLSYRNLATGAALNAAQTRSLVRQLRHTELLNQAEVLQDLQLTGEEAKGKGFLLPNPYFPRYRGQDIAPPKLRQAQVAGQLQSNPEGYAQTQEGYFSHADGQREYYGQKPVAQWYSSISHGGAAAQEVCAVRFESGQQQRYRLQTFASAQAALAAGWRITHQYHCGACSSLRDLGVYIGRPDLTAPARLCAKQGYGQNANLGKVKACMQRSTGLSPACAESWAYNAMHTAQQCMGVCLQTYGAGKSEGLDLLARAKGAYQLLVQEKFQSCPPQVPSQNPAIGQALARAGCPLENENTGKLNACLWCDERISGPGFKYQAARTRRNSGLESEIPRDNDHLFYQADHSQYFLAQKPGKTP